MKRYATHKLLLITAISAAGISGALGLVVLFGWHTHNVTLIQVLPAFVPMQYNTALGFLLCGIGILSQSFGNKRLAMAFGGTVAALGFLTLMQYVSGADFGIDQIFMKHYISVETSHPGRMAPNTALCFSLSGLAIIIMSKFSNRYFVGGVLGSIIIALGAVAFFGYFSGVKTAYGWGNLTRMAVHTSAGFIIVGASIFMLAWRDEMPGDIKTIPKWIVFSAGVFLATVTVTLWQALMAQTDTGQSVILPLVVLFSGLIMTVLLILTLLFAQASYRYATDLVQANLKLEAEIVGHKKASDRLGEEIKEHRRDEDELELQYKELKKTNKSFVGRELKMVELKKEIEELKKNK